MNYTVPVIIIAAVLAIVLLGMYLGWRRRGRSSTGSAYAVPADARPATVESETFYVATTRHEAPLERLALKGLAYRARARVAIGPDGIRLSIPGSDDIWIPTSAIRGAGPATYAIDRVVEPGGLVCVTWQVDGAETIADSYLRFTDPAQRVAVLSALEPLAPITAPIESES